jgi:uncharacterized Zn finger protein (UPF0148 family)
VLILWIEILLGGEKMGTYVCDCCGHKTMNEKRSGYEICPVCFWQDDGYIDDEGYYDTGANHVNLSEAQANYKEFGACEKRVVDYVREPHEDEPYIGELESFIEKEY